MLIFYVYWDPPSKGAYIRTKHIFVISVNFFSGHSKAGHLCHLNSLSIRLLGPPAC